MYYKINWTFNYKAELLPNGRDVPNWNKYTHTTELIRISR